MCCPPRTTDKPQRGCEWVSIYTQARALGEHSVSPNEEYCETPLNPPPSPPSAWFCRGMAYGRSSQLRWMCGCLTSPWQSAWRQTRGALANICNQAHALGVRVGKMCKTPLQGLVSQTNGRLVYPDVMREVRQKEAHLGLKVRPQKGTMAKSAQEGLVGARPGNDTAASTQSTERDNVRNKAAAP